MFLRPVERSLPDGKCGANHRIYRATNVGINQRRSSLTVPRIGPSPYEETDNAVARLFEKQRPERCGFSHSSCRRILRSAGRFSINAGTAVPLEIADFGLLFPRLLPSRRHWIFRMILKINTPVRVQVSRVSGEAENIVSLRFLYGSRANRIDR